jgi:uncharacterized protein Smg (DUF494 family)
MNMKKIQLIEATERSASHDVIVHIDCDDVGNALRWLESIAEESDCEFAYMKNGDVIETWAYAAEDLGNGDMVWRVHLDCGCDE